MFYFKGKSMHILYYLLFIFMFNFFHANAGLKKTIKNFFQQKDLQISSKDTNKLLQPKPKASCDLAKFVDESDFADEIDTSNLPRSFSQRTFGADKVVKGVALKYDIEKVHALSNSAEYAALLKEVQKKLAQQRTLSLKNLVSAIQRRTSKIEEQKGLGLILVYFADDMAFSRAQKIFSSVDGIEVKALTELSHASSLKDFSYSLKKFRALSNVDQKVLRDFTDSLDLSDED